ncbi:hypothetical protein K456DRAFT_50015 [Colletotrichum gloeosporioides 23]|nr:hypothetical protein K456DRAFT_50015 [Colletotrichum gloeosporioides 23]
MEQTWKTQRPLLMLFLSLTASAKTASPVHGTTVFSPSPRTLPRIFRPSTNRSPCLASPYFSALLGRAHLSETVTRLCNLIPIPPSPHRRPVWPSSVPICSNKPTT